MTKTKDINVVITGFGPYPDGSGGQIDPNTSYLLTTLLPKTLGPNTAQNPSPVRINILKPPSYVKTEYKFIREFCKNLHGNHADDADLFVHLGEARGWHWVTLERVAYKQGMSSVWWNSGDEKGYYMIPDNAGLTVRDAGPCPWDDVPMGLRSALDVDAVAEGARAILQTRYQFGKGVGFSDSSYQRGDTDKNRAQESESKVESPIEIRPHSEGGPYCCGFINYESLANCYANKRTPNVLFCHIPGEADQRSLDRTQAAIMAIIVSAVNEVLHQRTKKAGDDREGANEPESKVL
ncbi:hypothetical protein BJ170DRAFT_595562 [Xylariales sp. AK1849]|nr:hypothetical protein BJ170DRAFT_595562 [Xylariales sp. AK1849]